MDPIRPACAAVVSRAGHRRVYGAGLYGESGCQSSKSSAIGASCDRQYHLANILEQHPIFHHYGPAPSSGRPTSLQ